jgi:hypothetical protein
MDRNVLVVLLGRHQRLLRLFDIRARVEEQAECLQLAQAHGWCARRLHLVGVSGAEVGIGFRPKPPLEGLARKRAVAYAAVRAWPFATSRLSTSLDAERRISPVSGNQSTSTQAGEVTM